METAERIVETYVRYVKGWATIPNIRCEVQKEIDLLAIDPVSHERYHIETSVLRAQQFQRLTAKEYDPQKAKERVNKPAQRRTIGFFRAEKFSHDAVLKRLAEFGFEPGSYSRVIVSSGWDKEAWDQAQEWGIQLWDISQVLLDIGELVSGCREHFKDDTLRTLNLFTHACDEAVRTKRMKPGSIEGAQSTTNETSSEQSFWVYENWTHDYASIHLGSCSRCNDGRGQQGHSSDASGRWHGAYATAGEAVASANATGRKDIKRCSFCSPVIPN